MGLCISIFVNRNKRFKLTSKSSQDWNIKIPIWSKLSKTNPNPSTQTQLKALILFHINTLMIKFIPKTVIFSNIPIRATKTATHPIPSTNSQENHPTTQSYTNPKLKTYNYNPITINLSELNHLAKLVPPYNNKSISSSLKNLNYSKKSTGSMPSSKKWSPWETNTKTKTQKSFKTSNPVIATPKGLGKNQEILSKSPKSFKPRSSNPLLS